MHCLEVIHRLNDQFVNKIEEQFEFESYQRSDDSQEAIKHQLKGKKMAKAKNEKNKQAKQKVLDNKSTGEVKMKNENSKNIQSPLEIKICRGGWRGPEDEIPKGGWRGPEDEIPKGGWRVM